MVVVVAVRTEEHKVLYIVMLELYQLYFNYLFIVNFIHIQHVQMLFLFQDFHRYVNWSYLNISTL